MALTKGLLLKGLAGFTVCGGAATGGTLFATGVIGGGGENNEPVDNNLTTNTDPNLAPAQTPSGGDSGAGTTDSNQDGTVQQTDNRDNTHQVTQTGESDTLEKQKGQESNGKSQEGSENPTNPSNSLSTSQGGSTDDQNKTQQGSQISGEPSSSPTTTEGGQVGDGQQVNQVQDDQHTGDNEGLPSPVPGGASGTQGDKPAVDNTGSTPPGSSGADGTPGSTSTNEPGTEGGNSADGVGGSELSDISTTDQASQSKEDKINAKLVELGLPKDKCNFVKDETTKTCQISEKELKKIKFEDSENDDDEGEASASEGKKIQLKIEILTGNKKTDYGLNDSAEDGDDSDVTKDLLFTLSGFDNEINVGHDSTTLYPNTNPEFKVGNDELEKLWGTHSDLTGKVGIKKEDNSYKFDSTQSLKYSLDSGENINTLNSPTTTGTISVSDNNSNYNLGIKVNFSATVTSSSGGSDSLESGDYEIKYKDGDNGGWYLSKVTKPAGGSQA